jgi:hypothetical protein
MNKPSKTQMSEPKKKEKTKNQKKNRPVVSWWVGIVRWAEATKPREVERDRPDGGRRHCWWWTEALAVATLLGFCPALLGWERGREKLWEREREGKWKWKWKPRCFGFGFEFFFYFLFFNRLVNPGWVNQPKCGKKSDWLLLRSITQN